MTASVVLARVSPVSGPLPTIIWCHIPVTLRVWAIAHCRLLAALVGLALLAPAGCGGTPDPAAAPTSTAAPMPSTTAAPPSAADSGDLAACQDGSCEVRVDGPASIPLDPRFRIRSVQVESISATTADIRMEYPGGFYFDSQCGSGGCTTTLGEGVFRATVSAGSTLNLPAITIEAVAVGQGAAVLRFGLPVATDGTDLGACADGTCAVLVDKPVLIPLDPQFQFNNLRIESIAADAVTIMADYVGTVEFICPDDKCRTVERPGGFRSTLTLGSRLYNSVVSIQVAAVNEGTAVVRVKPEQSR